MSAMLKHLPIVWRKMQSAIIAIIEAIGGQLIRLLSYFLVYIKGRYDEKKQLQSKSVQIKDKQNEIANGARLDRNSILKRLHDGDM